MPSNFDRLMEAVRGVLLHEWDPIGVAANARCFDEYDGYARTICRYLMGGVDEHKLTAYLSQVRTVAMGLEPAEDGRDEMVARRLMELPGDLPPMAEGEFWPCLEWRVSGELADMRDGNLRRFWCDGFIPRTYHLDWPSPRIEGSAWIGEGSTQAEWEFTLLLPHAVGTRDEIAWASLVPQEDVTRWMTLDRARKRIVIAPSAAVPNPS